MHEENRGARLPLNSIPQYVQAIRRAIPQDDILRGRPNQVSQRSFERVWQDCEIVVLN
jgi:hypothetical protein